MSLIRLSVSTLAVALVACQATPVPSTSATATGTLRGKAKLDGEASARGITVLLSGPSSRAAVTADDGVYEFTKIEPGTYVVAASAPSTDPESVSTTVTVPGSGNADAADLILKPYGTIAGTAALGEATGNAGIAVAVAGSPVVTVTDDAGHFTLTRVPTGARTVVASYPGYASATSAAVTVRYNTSVDAPALTLTHATQPGAIQGTVKLIGEERHDGIVVSLSGPVGGSAITDVNGAYSLAGLPPGKYLVTAAARSTVEGVLSTSVTIGTELAQATELDFTPLGSVTGHVTLGTATGNAGIVVSLTGTSVATVTDDAGEFTLRNVPTGTWSLAASFAGYVSTSPPSVKVSYAGTASLSEYVLTRSVEPGGIEGRVWLQGGTVPAGTTITLSGPVNAVTLAQSSGAYSFSGLKPGYYTVFASLPSTDNGTRTTGVTVDKTIVTAGDLFFMAQGTVAGIVTLGGPTGNAGITVAVHGLRSDDFGVTDDAGRYTIPHVNTGSLLVRFSYPGYVSTDIYPVVLNYADVVAVQSVTLVKATQPGSLSGVATVAGETTQPAMIVQLAGPSASTTQTDATGAYSFSGLAAGHYTVTVLAASTAEGSQTVAVDVTSTAATATPITFTPVGTLTGLATLAGQTTHAGIAVSVPATQLTAYTDASGAFTIRGVPTGTRSVFASTPGYSSVTSNTALVRYAQTSAVTPALILSPTASAASPSINGIATLVGRSDLSGTTVSVVGTNVSTTTAADGSYVLQNPPPGMLSLRFTNGVYTETLTGVLSLAGTNGQIFNGTAFIPLAALDVPAGKRVLTGGSGMLPTLTYSKDGTVATYTEVTAGKKALKVISFATGQITTLAPDIDLYRLTTDGQRVLYTTRNGTTGAASTLWTVPIAGGSPTILSVNLTCLGTLSDDNSTLWFATPAVSGTGYDVKVVAAAGGVATTVLASASAGDFSSDGTSRYGFTQLSGNGSFLVYTSGSTLYSVVTASGFTPITLATSVSSSVYMSPASTFIVYRPSGTNNALNSVPMTGGSPVTIISSTSYAYFDGISPNGAYVAYDVTPSQYVAPLDGSGPSVTIGSATSALAVGWVNDGQGTPGVIWPSGGVLYYNAVTGGTAVALTPGTTSTPSYAISADGRTVYATNGPLLNAYSIPSGAPRQITDKVSTSYLADPLKMSPDGTKILFSTEDIGGRMLMTVPTAGGTPAAIFRVFDGAGTDWAGNSRVHARRLGTTSPYQFQDGLYAVPVQ